MMVGKKPKGMIDISFSPGLEKKLNFKSSKFLLLLWLKNLNKF